MHAASYLHDLACHAQAQGCGRTGCISRRWVAAKRETETGAKDRRDYLCLVQVAVLSLETVFWLHIAHEHGTNWCWHMPGHGRFNYFGVLSIGTRNAIEFICTYTYSRRCSEITDPTDGCWMFLNFRRLRIRIGLITLTMEQCWTYHILPQNWVLVLNQACASSGSALGHEWGALCKQELKAAVAAGDGAWAD